MREHVCSRRVVYLWRKVWSDVDDTERQLVCVLAAAAAAAAAAPADDDDDVAMFCFCGCLRR